ncbi:MAG: M2 family metallopeptidase [Alphaproteobacteria bacterium]|nr:M2 family metallopeptidase [Alphaproteobacteria bacterium]
MRLRFLAAAAVAALLTGAGIGMAASQSTAPEPTENDAKAFIAQVEHDLAREDEYASRAAWVQNTYITVDTNWLNSRASAEFNAMAVKFAKEASRFDTVKTDPVTRRKLDLLKRMVVLPSPSRAGAAEELARLRTTLVTDYSTAKFTYKGKALTLDDMEQMFRTLRDPVATRTLWEGWRKVSSPQMKEPYSRLVTLANEGSRELGYRDTGALWRSWYDMPPDKFAARTDQLWSQVEPLYKDLHCYVRGKLNEKYGDAVQPKTGPIRADLTGNMWAQEWGNIYDIVAPKNLSAGYDLTAAMKQHGYTPEKIVRTADAWYQSIGFAPEPATFWERSQFTRPRDRDVVCHASAWDLDAKDDLRIKVCFTVSADDFFTAHHELGHNMYQRAYSVQPYLFQGGANDGFHEAIGDFAGLNALTPGYLKAIGLIDHVPGPEADIPYLLHMALDKVAFLPFGLLVDKWRWEVFSGAVDPAHYNEAWWALRKRYQGITPPGPRPANAFDPGAKFHIPNNTPYMRYFLANLYEFQFYRAACRQAGWTGPLNRCSIFRNRKVGEKFEAMMKMGASKPWPEALAAFTGEHDIDAEALVEYFAPLDAWLKEQNKGQTCGWQ